MSYIGDSLYSGYMDIQELFNNGHEYEFAKTSDILNYIATNTEFNSNIKLFNYDEIKQYIKYKCIALIYPLSNTSVEGSKINTSRMCINSVDMVKSGLHNMLGEDQISIIDTRESIRGCKIYRLATEVPYTVPSADGNITFLFWDLQDISRG